MKRTITFLLIFSMLFSLFSCEVAIRESGKFASRENEGNPPKVLKTDSARMSPEQTSVQVGKVSVDVGDYVLQEGETELSVSKLQSVNSETGEWMIEAYEISLGDLHELGDYITIRLPYQETFCEIGENPAACVGAKYKNEETGDWEDIPHEVDAQTREVIIYTDHLSVFGVFYTKNEGKLDAYITKINFNAIPVDSESAIAVINEFVTIGGSTGEKAAQLGVRLVANTDRFYRATGEYAGAIGAEADFIEAMTNILTLGNTVFSSELATQAFQICGDIGTLASAISLGARIAIYEKTDREVLMLYKEMLILFTSSSRTAARAVAGSAIYIFDRIIANLFEYGMALKENQINEVYLYFNTKFRGELSSGYWKARTVADWREFLIKTAEEYVSNPEDAKAAIEAEVERYCNYFWSLNAQDLAVVVSDMNKATKGSATVPHASEYERKTMTDAYRSELYRLLQAASQSASLYMKKKLEADYIKSLNRSMHFFNQTVTLRVIEEMPDDGVSKFEGYTVRLSPLSDSAVSDIWQTTVHDGMAELRFTILAFLLAGCPNEVQLYPPGAVPERSEPKQTLRYTLSAPVTMITVGGQQNPTFEEIAGNYQGTFTFTAMEISDEVVDGMSDSDKAGMLDFKKNVGRTENVNTSIDATGENQGHWSTFMPEPINIKYDPATGTLSFEGALNQGMILVKGTLHASYNEDQTGIVLTGNMESSYAEYGFDHVKITYTFRGEKPLD